MMAVLNVDSTYSVIFKPNSSLTANGKLKVILLLSIIPCLIGIGFSIVGAWLVMPFVGLEIIALAYAFYFINAHESDYERITIDGDKLVIEWCSQARIIQHVLNPYWTKLVRHESPNGGLSLGLIAYGKEVEIGRYLTGKQREALAEQLLKRIGSTF
jgi:uncharacterized membrane protein